MKVENEETFRLLGELMNQQLQEEYEGDLEKYLASRGLDHGFLQQVAHGAAEEMLNYELPRLIQEGRENREALIIVIASAVTWGFDMGHFAGACEEPS